MREGVLAHVRSQLLGLLGVKVLAGLIAALGFVSLLAVAADAVLVLPEWLRAHAVVFLGGTAALVVAAGALGARRLGEPRVARSFEEREAALGTTLTNAVQFSGQTAACDVGEYLRAEAVAYGRRKALPLTGWPLARRNLFALVALATLACTLWIVGPICFDGLFAAVLPRFLDPYGDHPPYSRLVLTVSPQGTEVLYGSQCEIAARGEGAPIEKLFLVAENAKGASEIVMFRRPDQSYMQTLTNLREDTRYWVTDGRARSPRYTIAVKLTPEITRVDVTATYPGYTALKERTFELKESTLQVPAGTTLAFRAASNRPLRGGTIELVPLLGGETRAVALDVEEERGAVVAGAFTASEGIVFTLNVSDVDGLEAREPRKGRVLLLPDRPPRITVLEPPVRSIATPNVSVPLRVRAEDDYAVAQVIWFRGLNQSIERPTDVAISAGAARADAQGRLDLADLGVHPGDRLEYFFEAVDNYPDGPNVAASRMCTLEIISEEEYRAALAQRALEKSLLDEYAALARQLKRVLERAQTWRDLAAKMRTPLAQEDAAEFSKAASASKDALDAYEKALDRKLAQVPRFPVEDEFKAHLAAQQTQLKRLRRLAEKLAQQGSAGVCDKKALDELVRELESLAGAMDENVGKPAEHLSSVTRLVAAANEFVRLTLAQKELVELLDRFQDREGPFPRLEQMELQDLAAAERRVRDGLKSFMEKVPDLAEDVPKDPAYDDLRKSVGEFLMAVRTAKIPEDLAAATDAIAGQEPKKGHAAAKDAYEKMDALVDKCKGTEGQGSQCMGLRFKPTLSQPMQQSLAQMLAGMKPGGQSGGASGGLMGEDVGLYGPNAEMAEARGRAPDEPVPGIEEVAARDGGVSTSSEPESPETPGRVRVRLQEGAKFPLRYRTIVGEYFRAMAESEE